MESGRGIGSFGCPWL